MFKIKNVHNGKNKFNMFVHDLSLEDLNVAITEMMLSYNTLNYIFTGTFDGNADYVDMLQRFIPVDFINKEVECLKKWDDCQLQIKCMIEKNNSFYSFFAEALMAYLNYKYLDTGLLSAVLSINDTLTDQRTGADSCMISEKYIVLGEAKFYKDFTSAKRQIISDFENKSLINKMNNLYRTCSHSEIYIKEINEKTKKLTFDEFLQKNIVLSGFLLHNKKNSYIYSDIDNIELLKKLKDKTIVFYHLPIESKEKLIYIIIKRAMELIVNEAR